MEYIFTADELNHIQRELGEMPAKYSFELIGFIRQKAAEQNDKKVEDDKKLKKQEQT